MKPHLRVGLSAALAGMLCGITSCEKEPLEPLIKAQASPATAAISKASYAEQVAYTHKHLAVLGKALMLLQKDERIRSLMYAEFNACKPGLENVLFKTLIEKATAQGIDLEAEMNRALTTAGIRETATNGMLAFKDIDGATWQPQIYIPNYAALKKADRVERMEGNSGPVFFTYAGEPGVTTYQTFQVDNTGVPVKAFVATEEIAATREIMIIGLSEKLGTSTDKSVNVDPSAISVKGRQIRTNGTAVEAKIGMMSLSTNREDWAGGASEVACVGAVVWRAPGGLNPYNPPNNTPDVARVGPNGQIGGYDGPGNTPVADWTRNEVSNQQWKTVDFAIVSFWNPYWYPVPGYHGPVDSKGDTAPYLIYEADAWPSAMRSKEWYLSTSPTTTSVYVFVEYRSSDVPFHEEIVTTDPTKASNSSADGYYSEQTTSSPFETTSFNYKGHYPITTQIQYWFYQ